MPLRIVLVEPLIPQNTGTIARLAAAVRTELHLVEPLGFELSDRYLKRAGLDYWPEVNLSVHRDWESCEHHVGRVPGSFWFFTTHSERSYATISYGENDILVFGNEERGLPPSLHERYADSRLTIPMENPKIRSLNLSNAVSIVVYEARRQLGFLGT